MFDSDGGLRSVDKWTTLFTSRTVKSPCSAMYTRQPKMMMTIMTAKRNTLNSNDAKE